MPAALISGASRGIGATLAIHLAQQGYQPVLIARHEDQLQTVAEQCDGQNAICLPMDVTDDDTIRQQLQKHLESLDLQIAILNQGIGYFMPFLDDTEQSWRRTMEVNLTACMHMAQIILPYLIKSTSETSTLVFTNSISGKLASANASAYHTSKHGLLGFAHCLFEEVREYGVKVASICPGFINTSLVQSKRLDRQKMIQPEDIAEAVDYVCHSSVHVCPVEMTLRPQKSPYI